MELAAYPVFVRETGVVPQGSALFVYSRSNNKFDVLSLKSMIHLGLIDGARTCSDIVDEVHARFPDVSRDLIQADLVAIVEFLDRRGYLALKQKRSTGALRVEYPDQWTSPKVVHADIELTKNCNLRCKYCYDAAGSGYRDLPVRTWIAILEALESQGLRAIKLSGGEPLCYPGFKELLPWASKRFIVSVNTNGTLVNDEMAELMAACRLQCVQISLDAPTPEVNDSMRGHGSWFKAVEGVRRLVAGAVPVRIGCTVHAGNESLIDDMKLFAAALGAQLNFEVMKPVGNADEMEKGSYVADACRIMANNTYEDYRGLNFLEVQCQAQLGFAGLTHLGMLKPCNLTEDFFESISADVIADIDDAFEYGTSLTYSLVDAACDSRAVRASDEHGFPRCILQRQ